MTTETPLPAFEHDPLPEHTSHFRLLHIVRGDFGQHVECEISAWPIDNAPRYYAISYTWGDPADTTEITVNGRSLVVRRNCEYVLQQAFATRKSEYFWVDAICIAQTTEEKNHQVGIMGQIYSGAEHVLACVGPHENNSQFLSKFIKERRSLVTSIKELGNRMWMCTDTINPIKGYYVLIFRCLMSMKPRTRQRLYRSFFSFMRRPYFKRLWIIQELHSAQSVSFCFGGAVEAAENLLALYNLLDMWCNYKPDTRLRFPLVRWLENSALRTEAYFRTKSLQAMQLTFTDLGTSPSLLNFACTAGKQQIQHILFDPDLQCADPRDRLFGLLSIIDEVPGEVPKPDYTKDRYQIALEALKLSDSYDGSGVSNKAQELCRIFQINGEEASLRNAIALRSSTSWLTARSDDTYSVHPLRHDYQRRGVKIFPDAEDLGLSGLAGGKELGMYVSAREHEGCRSLHFMENQNAFSIVAPRDTRGGDWWLGQGWSRERKMYLGLVVRKAEDGNYKVIGQTLGFKRDGPTMWELLNSHADVKWLNSFWHPEDALFLGWIQNELESHDVTQDRISEYVNRRICPWDGSSYFGYFRPGPSELELLG